MEMKKKIFDKDISDFNYAVFENCILKNEGVSIMFAYPCKQEYEVPVKEVLTWFFRPHYSLVDDNILLDWPNNKDYKMPENIFVEKLQFVLEKHAVRIFMNDKTVYDVAWDTVLMACEPRYEWFGGLP